MQVTNKPFLTIPVFDNTGGVYKVKKIVDAASGYQIDVQKYIAYSPVRAPPSIHLDHRCLL